MEIIKIFVPDLGNFAEVSVIDVLVKVGDRLEIDGPIATLETDKATMDVPSPDAGIVHSLHIEKGSKVASGSLLLMLSVDVVMEPLAAAAELSISNPSVSVAIPEVNPAAPIAILVQHSLPVIQESTFSRAHAGPSVRRLARELGVDLARVTGSAIKGRISHEDVKAWVKSALQGTLKAPVSALPKVPIIDFSAFGEIDTQPLSRVQKISGSRLSAAWINIPHVTQFDEADITELELLRYSLKDRAVEQGVKLTPLSFIIAACIRAINKFPKFNSSLDIEGKNLIYKKYFNLGFAADTPNGLLVPVIHDINKKDIFEIARDLTALSASARDGKLAAADMQGGCFTVSSLGGIGGLAFTPIINAPEVAILGVSRSRMKPIYRDGSFVPRLILPLSLSYDHRVIDGAEGVRFTSWLVECLSKPTELISAVTS